ncbi:hypothetical protein BDR07DRAFT_1489460 [Suillus spraguei]|nr:hypothetical protein BDR07DRAFT_1489460 [Suillus spraguei]
MQSQVPFFIEGIHILSSIQINNAVSTAPPNIITVYEGSSDFEDLAQSLADECQLHCYKGVYYNIPVQIKRKQFFYVVCGSHIGIVAGWEDALNCVLGIQNAEYHEVESIAIGERLLWEAIDQGKVEMVEPWM